MQFRVAHIRAAHIGLVLLALSACAPAQVSKDQPVLLEGVSFAPARSYPAAGAVAHGNASITRDFLDLTFAMENGRGLDTLSRFEGNVTIGLAGSVPAGAARDLAVLIARLQGEAGLNVAAAAPGEVPAITIEFSPKSALQRVAPSAACFVVPNVSSLAEYRSRRGTNAVDWGTVQVRTRAAIFVPSDTSPQEVRDCLHEEVAQALGPLNDLYRLPDSVFNDDNFNTVLTDFDMLMLRIYYAPQLRSGMTRDAVAIVVPGVVAALNPGGAGMGVDRAGPTPRAWTVAIETSLGKQGSLAARRTAAERALSIAKSAGWTDNRMAFSHFAVARMTAGTDRTRAQAEFMAAAAIYSRQPGGDVHVAHIEMQLTAMALASGNPQDALRLANQAIPVVQRHENAALLATLMLLKAEALEQLGDPAAAAALRLDSQPWARYGFGSEAVVKARMRDIATVAKRGTKS
ncbi:DUF2927 domain-containing protein [Tabrizicola sp.]|uniref:DUF2927 domain-containing protein n=1 Tax=Tabrizicola sp. TaxID=2005166 RepID=UPI00286BEA7B|nr:DUF2927 domain-containing protein [Tabrizicola sp.]